MILNKKAQGMPMNVVIIAIIVLVVLVILIAFFVGGFGSIVGKVRDLFTGQTTGQARDTAIQTCQNLCDTAASLPENSQRLSGYCTQSFVVDMDSNPNTAAERVICGSPAQPDLSKFADADNKRKIAQSGASLGVDCPEIPSCT